MELFLNKFKLLPISSSSKLRIGIMGGSFNPAHIGHKYITLEAIKRFNLDKVIWFVTLQNPLKILRANNYETRFKFAKELAHHPKIIVSDLEKSIKSQYSIILLKRLKVMYPNIEFAYIIGADNAVSFHKWKRWKEIIKLMPLLIFDREDFHKSLICSKISKNFNSGLFINTYNGPLHLYNWYFIKVRRNFQSSTKIRYEQENKIDEKFNI